MSLTSTITYDSIPQAKGLSFKGIGLMVAALIVGAAIGITIANNPTATETPAVSDNAMARDDFIRLNTTSYEGLVPAATATAVGAQGVGDAFIDMNVTSYEGLTPATAAETQRVGQAFLDMNVASYEAIAPTAATTGVRAQNLGSAFIDMNVTSFEGLTPVAATATQRVVDPRFLFWNVGAFHNLSPTEAQAVLRSMTTADRNLWALNVTSYGSQAETDTEHPGGPR